MASISLMSSSSTSKGSSPSLTHIAKSRPRAIMSPQANCMSGAASSETQYACKRFKPPLGDVDMAGRSSLIRSCMIDSPRTTVGTLVRLSEVFTRLKGTVGCEPRRRIAKMWATAWVACQRLCVQSHMFHNMHGNHSQVPTYRWFTDGN